MNILKYMGLYNINMCTKINTCYFVEINKTYISIGCMIKNILA